MNRTDRLYAIVEELRFAGDRGRTSESLARQLEVSTRSVKRDITALQEAGVPVWAQPGPGGGYRLLATSAALPPVTFTAGEAAAIAVALRTQSDLPFATEGAVALTKVLGAMTPAGRESVGGLLDRVWTTTKPSRSRAARTIDVAIARQRVVEIAYTAADGTTTMRKVDPLQFAHTGGRWYLLAWCRLRQGGRWFRLDRITSARLTKEPATHYDVTEVIGRPPPEAHPVG